MPGGGSTDAVPERYRRSTGATPPVGAIAVPSFDTMRRSGRLTIAISVNGVDMLKWDGEGRIVEFKVLIRPLKAINLIHQKMAAMLQAKQ